MLGPAHYPRSPRADDPSRPIPEHRRNDDAQLESFLRVRGRVWELARQKDSRGWGSPAGAGLELDPSALSAALQCSTSLRVTTLREYAQPPGAG
jgi:hypothetical protein